MSKSKYFAVQARALLIQKHQLDGSEAKLGQLDSALESMLHEKRGNQEILESLFIQAEALVQKSHIEITIDDEDSFLIEENLYIKPNEITPTDQEIETLDCIEINDFTNWEKYIDEVEKYAAHHEIDLGNDPFLNLMTTSQRITLEKRIKEEFSLQSANCDKYDYMIAGTCGIIGGLIDVFFVGLPGQGALTHFTDDVTDKAVQKFAKLNGWNGPREGKDPTASAIGFLERNYKVNYDHRHSGDVNNVFSMSTKNHHIKNLAHSPDLVGLFFSILDQFCSTAHFVDNGKIIKIDTESFELKGSNFVSKFFSGFTNWLGHLFSDVAGSSGSTRRGSRIPIPFYSLLQFINVGEFGQHRQTFANTTLSGLLKRLILL